MAKAINIEKYYKAKEFIYLLDKWIPECNENCYKCEFGVFKDKKDPDPALCKCAIDLAIDLIITETFDTDSWKKIKG